jgi:hypothetical protein
MVTVVVRPFEAAGKELKSGTVIDSTSWRNEARLINCRFLREATEREVADFKAKQAAPKTKAPAAKPAAKAAAPKKAAAKPQPKKRSTPVKPVTPAAAPDDRDDRLSI